MNPKRTLFETIRRENESKTALVLERIPHDPIVLSYVGLSLNVEKLKRQLPACTRIAVVLPICVESVVLLFAVSEAGSVFVPLNPESTESEFEYFLSLKIGLFISTSDDSVGSRVARRMKIPVMIANLSEDAQVSLTCCVSETTNVCFRVEDGEIAVILFTSGTSADPKAVGLTHTNLLSSVSNILESIPVTSSDVTLNVMPLFHIHGMVASVLTSLTAGGTVVFPKSGKFSARRFWPAMRGFQCTWFTAVPTIHQILLLSTQEGDSLSTKHLRFIRSSSSRLEPSLLYAMEERYKVAVIEAYAMTETSYQITSNPASKFLRKPGTVGIPQGSVKVKICDANNIETKLGEVCVKGPNVISNYLENPEADSVSFHTNDGYFRTGDEGFFDEDGFLTITGRLKEQINRGGEKINPNEIDQIAKSHHGVADAGSFGIPDPKYGELVSLAIMPRTGHFDKAEFEMFLRSKLSSFKVPSKIFVVDSIPKTKTGKTIRYSLSQLFV